MASWLRLVMVALAFTGNFASSMERRHHAHRRHRTQQPGAGAATTPTTAAPTTDATAAAATTGDATTAAAGSGEDAAALMTKSVNETAILRQTVAKVMHRSVEEVSGLKSLLMTSAKATGAMNELLLEMESLSARMHKFDESMEKCRQELNTLEAQEQNVVTPAEANDPMLGTTALVQLQHHAHRLIKTARELKASA